MSNYDLSDNVDETFPFQVEGKKYVMRYPLTSEVDKIQDFSAKIEEATKEERTDEAKELGDKLQDFIYNFITPVDHEEPIKEVLERQNVRVMRNFNRMMKTELSIS
jgi:hypothetical protein